MCCLSHVPLSEGLALVAHTDVTCAVAGRSCEACLPKVAQQQHSPALHLLFTVCNLHKSTAKGRFAGSLPALVLMYVLLKALSFPIL